MTNKKNIKQWIHFLVGGGINTVFTYAIYLILAILFPYQLAYLIAYMLGIVFAYWFNATVVFQVRTSWKGLSTYPTVYVVQYLASALLLGSLVEVVGVTTTWAPLVVTVIMVPITYIMSKMLLTRRIQ